MGEAYDNLIALISDDTEDPKGLTQQVQALMDELVATRNTLQNPADGAGAFKDYQDALDAADLDFTQETASLQYKDHQLRHCSLII